jgi:hypothetical protein
VNVGETGLFHLHPYAELRATYDSNVLLGDSDNEQDDVFFSGKVGVQQNQGLGYLRLGVDTWYYVERYMDVTEADDEDFGINFDIGIGDDSALGQRENIELKLLLNYAQTDAVDYETGNIEAVDTLAAGAGVGKTFGTVGDVDLMYTHSERMYDRSGNFDWNEDKLRLDVQPRLTDKTRGILTGVYASQESDATSGSENSYEARAGLGYKATEKTQGFATVGYATHERFDADTVSFEASANWLATDKLSLGLHAGNEFIPSVRENNLNLSTFAGLSAAYRVSDNVNSLASVDLRNNSLEQQTVLPDGSTTSGDSATYTGRLALIYTPPGKPYSIFADTLYESRDSDLSNDDYVKSATSLGVRVAY